jgi:hypothetical protein
MKLLLSTLLLLGFTCNISYAQHSVTITQQGNGNKATVTQSNNNAASNAPDDSCKQIFSNRRKRGNRIIVRKIGGQPDTLLNNTGKQQNVVSRILAREELIISQYGKGNGVSIIAPDSQKTYHRFKASQKGAKNRMSARLNDEVGDVNLSQKGNDNRAAINPCKSHH